MNVTQNFLEPDIKVISIKGEWRKIFAEENNTTAPITVTSKWTSGFKTHKRDDHTVIARHSVDAGASANISLGDMIKVLSVKANYEFQHTKSVMTLKELEINKIQEHTAQFTVPPWKKITRWQFVSDIAGNDLEFYDILSTMDDEVPRSITTTATVRLRKMIEFGKTPFRIKHKEKGLYMMIVQRLNWPAATLSQSNTYKFLLEDRESRGVRVQTLNTTSDGYVWMYSSDQGGIYFDLSGDSGSSYNGKQYWFLSKDAPLYDGDVVTFRNNNFSSSFLCYHDGPATNVYCLEKQEDQWVVEISE